MHGFYKAAEHFVLNIVWTPHITVVIGGDLALL